jgi:hypothetical protein
MSANAALNFVSKSMIEINNAKFDVMYDKLKLLIILLLLLLLFKYLARWLVTVSLHLFNGLPRLLFPCGL